MKAWWICSASSRVGAMTKARTPRLGAELASGDHHHRIRRDRQRHPTDRLRRQDRQLRSLLDESGKVGLACHRLGRRSMAYVGWVQRRRIGSAAADYRPKYPASRSSPAATRSQYVRPGRLRQLAPRPVLSCVNHFRKGSSPVRGAPESRTREHGGGALCG